MNKKITYKFTANYDSSKPDCNFIPTSDYIITDGVYDFGDFLRDRNVDFEIEDERFYFVLNDEGERAGECYAITSEEDTTEEPRA